MVLSFSTSRDVDFRLAIEYKPGVLTALSPTEARPSMKVRIHGFELVLGTKIILDRFLKDLQKHSGERVDNPILASTISTQNRRRANRSMVVRHKRRLDLLTRVSQSVTDLLLGEEQLKPDGSQPLSHWSPLRLVAQ